MEVALGRQSVDIGLCFHHADNRATSKLYLFFKSESLLVNLSNAAVRCCYPETRPKTTYHLVDTSVEDFMHWSSPFVASCVYEYFEDVTRA